MNPGLIGVEQIDGGLEFLFGDGSIGAISYKQDRPGSEYIMGIDVYSRTGRSRVTAAYDGSTVAWEYSSARDILYLRAMANSAARHGLGPASKLCRDLINIITREKRNKRLKGDSAAAEAALTAATTALWLNKSGLSPGISRKFPHEN